VPVKLRRFWLALACVALCTPGCGWVCGKKNPGAKDAAAEVVASVELVSPGAEPRQKLEVARWTGLSYELSSESNGSFGVQGLPPGKSPTSTMTLRFEVVRGTADPIVRDLNGHEAHLVEEHAVLRDIGLKSDEIPAPALAQLNAGFGLLRGLGTRQLVAEDGELAEVTAESFGGQKLPPEIKKILDDLLDTQRHFPFRLPHDPVGKGARWRFTEPLPMRGIKTMQIADMTLNAINEQTVSIGIKVRLQADKQNVPHPNDPTITASLDKYRGDAEGELVLDRLTAVVLSSRLANTSVITLSWKDREFREQNSTYMSASVIRMKGRIGPFDADDAATDAGDAGSTDASSPDGARDQ
jgi:hypothetical protein